MEDTRIYVRFDEVINQLILGGPSGRIWVGLFVRLRTGASVMGLSARVARATL